MPIPLLALAYGGVIATRLGIEGKRRSRSRERLAAQEASFDSAVDQLVMKSPDESGPPTVHGMSGAGILPNTSIAIKKLYDADPDTALAFLREQVSRNMNEVQSRRTAGIQAEGNDLRRDQLNLDKDKFSQEQLEWQKEQNRLNQGSLPGGYKWKQVAGRTMAIPIEGSPDHLERVDSARESAQRLRIANNTLLNMMITGVIRDPSAPGYGQQQSNLAQLVGGVKEALTLGAFDEGVTLFGRKVIPDQLDTRDWLLGNDREVIERLQTTINGLFRPDTEQEFEKIAYLDGDPGAADMAQVLRENDSIQGMADNVTSKLAGEGMINRNQFTAGANMSMLGAQIDEIVSGLLGGVAGAALRGRMK